MADWIAMDDRTSYLIEKAAVRVSADASDESLYAEESAIAASLSARLGGTWTRIGEWQTADGEPDVTSTWTRSQKKENYVENTAETIKEPAVSLGHLLKGPAAIEASERAGQAQLLRSSVLPSQMGDRAAFEALGFRFGEAVDGDPLFIHAELPDGWKKVGSDHAMHSSIEDAEGKVRVRIFYKAAFYDRRAEMHLQRDDR